MTTVFYPQVQKNNKWFYVSKAPYYFVEDNAADHARVYANQLNDKQPGLVTGSRAVPRELELDGANNPLY